MDARLQRRCRDTKKQIYAQGFAIYALSEYYQLTQDEVAEVLGNPELLEKVKNKAILMSEITFQKAIDKNGAVLYEEHDGKISDSDRHWWVQAEAMVGFVNAYQLTNDTKYLQTAKNIWLYINNYLIDKSFGAWYWRTDKENKLILTENKVGPWKAPYHNVRALLEILHRTK